MSRAQYTGFLFRWPGRWALLLLAIDLISVSLFLAQAFFLALATMGSTGHNAPALDARGRLIAAGPEAQYLCPDQMAECLKTQSAQLSEIIKRTARKIGQCTARIG